MENADQPACPLCGGSDPSVVPDTGAVVYRDCPGCGLVSMHPAHLPGAEAEKAHYDTHENDPGDARYRAFLDRLVRPLKEKLVPGAEGLDYGSGPGPTLSVMMEEAGYAMRLYDPFYAPEAAALARRYDFVTCTETAEHFHNPNREFDRLAGLLGPGGWLGVMTEILEPETDFASWWYRRDPTHVVFYREETFRWLARQYDWHCERAGEKVFLFRRDDAK